MPFLTIRLRRHFQKLKENSLWKWQGKLITIVTAQGDSPLSLYGIIVGKKSAKGVRRNRIRRIIREYLRIKYDIIPKGILLLVIVHPSVRELSDRKLSFALREELSQGLLAMPQNLLSF